jgi:acetyl-CoA carboxylase carboxyltransferase component
VVHRRQLSGSADVEALRAQLADEYFEEHLRAETAAAAGFVDELVEPADTRDRLASALWTLAGSPPL